LNGCAPDNSLKPTIVSRERDDPWTTERIAGAYLRVQPMK
jgi:hypothetical protein